MRATLAAIALIVLAAVPASAQTQPVRLRSAYSTIGIGHSLVWVAKDSGSFKENGIDLQLLFIGRSTTVTQTLRPGAVPIPGMAGGEAISSSLSASALVMLASVKKDPSQAYLGPSRRVP